MWNDRYENDINEYNNTSDNNSSEKRKLVIVMIIILLNYNANNDETTTILSMSVIFSSWVCFSPLSPVVFLVR